MTQPVKLKYCKHFGANNLVIALRSYSGKKPTTVTNFLPLWYSFQADSGVVP